jgi:hypothetical protein
VALRSLKEETRKVSERLRAVPTLKIEHSTKETCERLAHYMRANPEATFSNSNAADFTCKIIANRDELNINPESVRENFSKMLALL